MLTRSSGPMKLREWYRRLVRADLAATGGRVLVIKAAAKAPARAAREAYDAVRLYGTRALETHGVSRLQQFILLWWLNVRHGLLSDSFYSYELFRPDRRQRASRFVQGPEAARLYRLLAARRFTREAEILADKRTFEAWCEENALPTISILAEFEDGRMSGSVVSEPLPAWDLFAKSPVDYGGRGVSRWRHIAPNAYEGEGRRLSSAELVRELARRSAAGPLILQRAESNHPSLAGVTAGALCTLRLLTVRAPDSCPEIVAAAFRMAVGGAAADNYAQGGIASAVNLDAGTLGPGVRYDGRGAVRRFTTHPDTGARITGTRLPFWTESVHLVLRAHALLGGIPVVGWDVALLANGPLLLEGNWNPGVKTVQMPSGVPLGDTAYAACLNVHLEATFDVSDAPGMRAASLWEPQWSSASPGRECVDRVPVEELL